MLATISHVKPEAGMALRKLPSVKLSISSSASCSWRRAHSLALPAVVAAGALRRPLAQRRLGARRGSFMDMVMAPEDPNNPQPMPFGDGGGDQEAQSPRIYTHGACKSREAQACILNCGSWQDAAPDSPERRELAAKALHMLRNYGFVVLENLFEEAALEQLEAEASVHLDTLRSGGNKYGIVGQPLRAGRTEVPPPCEGLWANEDLLCNDLILEVASHYICNQLADGRNEDEQQWAWVQWVTAGAELGWIEAQGSASPEERKPFKPGCSVHGQDGDRGPWLGQVTLIESPGMTQPQKKHRDIILPGPMAQLTMQIALTPFTATNGPVAFRPASHRMITPGFEIVAVPPRGSAVLYDSFTEHRGLENLSSRTRYALYAEFESRGVFTGYPREHFGEGGAVHMDAFRNMVDSKLQKWRDIAKRAPQPCSKMI